MAPRSQLAAIILAETGRLVGFDLLAGIAAVLTLGLAVAANTAFIAVLFAEAGTSSLWIGSSRRMSCGCQRRPWSTRA